MKHKIHKHTHTRDLRGSWLSHLIFSRFIIFFRAGQKCLFQSTSSPICLSHSELISSIHTHAWITIELSWNTLYYHVFLHLTAQLTSALTVNSTKNKQQLGRRNSRKTFVFIKWIWREQVCFAGSGSLPLSPWPRAAGPFRAWLVEWRKEVDWLSTGSTGSASLRPSLNPGGSQTLLPVCLRPADVSHRQTTTLVLEFQTNWLPIAMAVRTTTMENARPRLRPCLP